MAQGPGGASPDGAGHAPRSPHEGGEVAASRVRPRRRDRHGRGLRGPLVPSHLPGHRTRREEFDDVVLEAADPILDRFGRRLEHLAITVEEVPPADPAPWEMQTVPLGRYIPPDRDHPPQVVLFRRPIVTRCTLPGDLEALVRQVLAEQVASMLGVSPEDVDPDLWG